MCFCKALIVGIADAPEIVLPRTAHAHNRFAQIALEPGCSEDSVCSTINLALDTALVKLLQDYLQFFRT